MKRVFFHGITTGAIAALACILYGVYYNNALAVDFSKVVNTFSIAGINIAIGLLASLGYYFLLTRKLKNPDVVFNVVFTVLTFVSLVGPIAIKLPLSVQSPELFPGLVIPMHFLPQLFWLSTKPLFKYA